MNETSTPLKTKSLRLRLLWGFVLCAVLIWVGLVSWGYYTLTTDGRKELVQDMADYAHQVLAVAAEFREYPERLATAVGRVVEIDNRSDDSPDEFYIQIWVDDRIINQIDILPSTPPSVSGFAELVSGDTVWFGSTAIDPERNVIVRAVVDKGLTLNLTSEQAFFLFLPLIFSLPLLFLPAWFMTRRGLSPLREVVSQIHHRVDSGELTALHETPWRELNPVVQATNSLMQRLSKQLSRERAFVADVAHELKTPLAIMQSNVGLLKNSSDELRRQGALKDLSAGLKRGNHLIEQLLRISRLEQRSDGLPTMLRTVDVAEFIRERVAQAVVLANAKEIDLHFEAPSSMVIDTDADAIAAVVDNLIDNAIKYSPPESAVILTLIASDTSEWIEIVVQDQGPGISESNRTQVFERFTRLHDTGESNADVSGAGLGLSIVAQAIRRLNGEISLNAAGEKGGLRVQVRLPIKRTGQASKLNQAV